MRLLNSLQKGERATIVAIHDSGDLRKRLQSFAIRKGVEVTVREFSPAKRTLKIEVNNMMLALRFLEAEKIEVV